MRYRTSHCTAPFREVGHVTWGLRVDTTNLGISCMLLPRQVSFDGQDRRSSAPAPTS